MATEPGFADDLISRSLVRPTRPASKRASSSTNGRNRVAGTRPRSLLPYSSRASVVEVSARADPTRRGHPGAAAGGQSSILIGQSAWASLADQPAGAGRDIAVREISAALDTGKHTTTFTRLYKLDELGANSSITIRRASRIRRTTCPKHAVSGPSANSSRILAAASSITAATDRTAMRHLQACLKARSPRCAIPCTASCCTNRRRPCIEHALAPAAGVGAKR